MSDTPTIDNHTAWYEFRWLALVGLFICLFAFVAGSLIVALAGLLTWAAFNALARRFQIFDTKPVKAETPVHTRLTTERLPMKEQVAAR